MSENNKLEKINTIKKSLLNFLNKHRFNNESDNELTHRSYGCFIQGNFSINKDDINTFMDLYIDAINNNIEDLSILEIQKEYSPILIDIDLNIYTEKENYNERLYDEKMINDIIKMYNTAIKKYLVIPEENSIWLFEKKKGRYNNDDNKFKDGYHIMYPDLVVNSELRHLIRYDVVKMCSDNNIFENFNEPPDTIIDKAVVSSNGWFLYGSKKPECSLSYKLSKIYNFNNNEIIYDYNINENLPNDIIIKKISIHFKHNRYTKKKSNKIKEEYSKDDIKAEIEKCGINTNIFNNDIIERGVDIENNIRKAIKYSELLNPERANNYIEWINVGLALFNTDRSLLPAWINFSKKCPKSFNKGDGQGNCVKYWHGFKINSNNLLTVKSLRYWANIDNPKECMLFHNEEFEDALSKNLNNNNTYSLAKTFITKYPDIFVCSSSVKNLWWEFKEHKWHFIDGASTIIKLLSEDFANHVLKKMSDYALLAIKCNCSTKKAEYDHKISKLNNIKENLMNISFKNKIVEECRYLYLDNKFEEKLDSNTKLLGCKNGVFDLEKEEFRDGKPEDYISLTTKLNYIKFSPNNQSFKDFLIFCEQILPNDNIRNFLLIIFSSCVSGDTNLELFNMLYGCGSNGKSVFMDIMSKVLGEYYMSCPISMITKKRGNSNETSPAQVRMKGKRCGVFQETDVGENLNVGVLKEYTGGDTVLVRDLFKNSKEMIEYKPQIKLFLTCNTLPEVGTIDDGTWRRLKVIEFKSKFVDNPDPNISNEFKIDTNLKYKIDSWSPVILSYFIHLYLTQYKNKTVVIPSEVLLSTNLYKADNDYCTDYIFNNITKTTNPKDRIDSSRLFESFKLWYKTNNNNSKLTMKKSDFIKSVSKILGPLVNNKFINSVYNVGSEDSSNDEQ